MIDKPAAGTKKAAWCYRRGARSYRHLFISLLSFCAALSALPIAADAVTIDDFRVETARQLADLCRTVPKDNDSLAATQFCQGFITGAYRYHLASQAGPGSKPVICFQGSEPSRGKAAAEFVSWLDAHPQYAGEDAVEAQFKWLTDTWPCKN
ncbi:MAG TPA: Rap1a/Tai family immunity protein [Dongiaceae bacterium]|nr:Rap1a/Tai family immunity protein [Dongiaceae bacterium]